MSSNHERLLKDELFGCFKHIGIPFQVLEKMPVRDRKFYIAKHNGIIEAEEMKEKGNTIDGEMINKYTDMSQLSDINSRKRS
jgi:repressor of nif and glnA expression